MYSDTMADFSPSGSDSEAAPERRKQHTRDCALCSKPLPKRAFSGNQWRKGPSAAACTACVQAREDPRQVPRQKANVSQSAREEVSRQGQGRQVAGKRQAAADPRPAAAPPTVRKFNPNSRTSSTTLSQITKSRFADLPVGVEIRRACAEILGYEHMSKVQEQTIEVRVQQNRKNLYGSRYVRSLFTTVSI